MILELRRRGLQYFRFNTEDLPSRCRIIWEGPSVDGAWIQTKGKSPLQISSVSSVWYRRPKGPSLLENITDKSVQLFVAEENDAVLTNLWRCLERPRWVSRPERIRDASHRMSQLELAKMIGFRVPKTIVSNDLAALVGFYDRFRGDVVAKTLHHQSARTGDSYLIYTTRISRADLTVESVNTPVMLQEYIPKAREFRATVIGRKVFSVALDSQAVPEAQIDWRLATSEVPHTYTKLPELVSQALIEMTDRLGLLFGAFDLIETTSGDVVFLELNPNGQWAWLEQLTGVPMREALIDLLVTGESSANSCRSL